MRTEHRSELCPPVGVKADGPDAARGSDWANNSDYGGGSAARGGGTTRVLWSSLGLAGRQLTIMVFSLVFARLLGPQAYGVIAQAAVFMTLSTLLLDQGISAALISSRSVSRRQAGAATTVNLLMALLLSIATVLLAGRMAVFFDTPELVDVLRVLGAGLVLKALAVVPRMLLTRSMDFRGQAVADLGGALVGGGTALVAALAGAGYWTVVIQMVTADLVVAVVLVVVARPPLPNLRLGLLRDTLGFSSRAFTSNLLTYCVQNVDNLLVGRFVGPVGLAQYALAYRVLTTPLQMVSQVVTRVLFPAVARARHGGRRPTELVGRCMRCISLVTFPVMALVAVAAPQAVPTLLGPDWAGAVPIVSILALGGARQSVTSLNTPVTLGMGRSDLLLRLAFCGAALQLAGILLGLPYGAVGVAAGLTIAGFLLLPVVAMMQKRLAGLEHRAQLAAVWPAVHGSVWLVLVYLSFGLVGLRPAAHLWAGGLAGLATYAGVLLVAHPGSVRPLLARLAAERRRPGTAWLSARPSRSNQT